jgi:hypothetical protein
MNQPHGAGRQLPGFGTVKHSQVFRRELAELSGAYGVCPNVVPYQRLTVVPSPETDRILLVLLAIGLGRR